MSKEVFLGALNEELPKADKTKLELGELKHAIEDKAKGTKEAVEVAINDKATAESIFKMDGFKDAIAGLFADSELGKLSNEDKLDVIYLYKQFDSYTKNNNTWDSKTITYETIRNDLNKKEILENKDQEKKKLYESGKYQDAKEIEGTLNTVMSNPKFSEIDITLRAGVDGIAYKDQNKWYTQLMSEGDVIINKLQSSIITFTEPTKTQIQTMLSLCATPTDTSAASNNLIKFAEQLGADKGNQALYRMRSLRAIEASVDSINTNKQNISKLHNIIFDMNVEDIMKSGTTSNDKVRKAQMNVKYKESTEIIIDPDKVSYNIDNRKFDNLSTTEQQIGYINLPTNKTANFDFVSGTDKKDFTLNSKVAEIKTIKGKILISWNGDFGTLLYKPDVYSTAQNETISINSDNIAKDEAVMAMEVKNVLTNNRKTVEIDNTGTIKNLSGVVLTDGKPINSIEYNTTTKKYRINGGSEIDYNTLKSSIKTKDNNIISITEIGNGKIRLDNTHVNVDVIVTNVESISGQVSKLTFDEKNRKNAKKIGDINNPQNKEIIINGNIKLNKTNNFTGTTGLGIISYVNGALNYLPNNAFDKTKTDKIFSINMGAINKNDITTIEMKETNNIANVSPEMFIEERLKTSLTKSFTLNGSPIGKTDISKIIMDPKNPNTFEAVIKGSKIRFKNFKKINEDRDFAIDQKTGDFVKKPEDRVYYEGIETDTNEIKDKFKVFNVVGGKGNIKNPTDIKVTLDLDKTKAEVEKYFGLPSGYKIDSDLVNKKSSINITPSSEPNKIETVSFDIKHTLSDNIKKLNPAADKVPQKTEDIIENVALDGEGNLKLTNGQSFSTITGKESLTLQTKNPRTVNGIITYLAEDNKKLEYHVGLTGQSFSIYSNEVVLDKNNTATELNKEINSVVVNSNNVSELLKDGNYATDLDKNFSKWSIEAKIDPVTKLPKGGYTLHATPNTIAGFDGEITVDFDTKVKADQTKYFNFDEKSLVVPEKYRDNSDKQYIVSDNFYYFVNIPQGDQKSINPGVTVDLVKTEQKAIEKTKKNYDNSMKNLPAKETRDSDNLMKQNVSLRKFGDIKVNTLAYQNYRSDVNTKEIYYERELYLDENFMGRNPHISLGTLGFDGNGYPMDATNPKAEGQETLETTKPGNKIKVNRANQTIEVGGFLGYKDEAGNDVSVSIPFEIKDKQFILGSIKNEDAKEIQAFFAKQQEGLKDNIYKTKNVITKSINNNLNGSTSNKPEADQFPGLDISRTTLGDATNSINSLENVEGPNSDGIYSLNLHNENASRESKLPDYVLFKVVGGSIKLVDINGEEVDAIYVQKKSRYEKNKGIVKITVSDNKFEFEALKEDKNVSDAYPKFEGDVPASISNAKGDPMVKEGSSDFFEEGGNKYMRLYGEPRLGCVASIPVKEEIRKGIKTYELNESDEKLKQNEETMPENLFDQDLFKEYVDLGVDKTAIKEVFMEKFKNHRDIKNALRGNNLRVKNQTTGKYEFVRIEKSTFGNSIQFKENDDAKKILDEVTDAIKKDLNIVQSIEKINFVTRGSDDKKNVLNPWSRGGSRAFGDLTKDEIKDFMLSTKEDGITLNLKGPSNEPLTLNINKSKYKDAKAAEFKNYYLKGLFEEEIKPEGLDIGTSRYKLELIDNGKNYQLVFEEEVKKE